jgi:hypothetical protein
MAIYEYRELQKLPAYSPVHLSQKKNTVKWNHELQNPLPIVLPREETKSLSRMEVK